MNQSFLRHATSYSHSNVKHINTFIVRDSVRLQVSTNVINSVSALTRHITWRSCSLSLSSFQAVTPRPSLFPLVLL